MLMPTGTGKGVSFVIPNLLFWDNSIIIHDIKLENYELTSGYRKDKLKHKVFVWDPTAENNLTNCYNPLDWISKDKDIMVNNIQTLLKSLLPEVDYLQIEAKNLLTGIILYLLSEDKTVTFGRILRIVRSSGFLDDLENILDNVELHPTARMNITSFLKKSKDKKLHLVSFISNALDLWSDPLIDYATSKSDFNISTFTSEKQTLYVGVNVKDMERLKPLFSMFYQQCFNIIVSSKVDYQKIKYGILMILDEFTTIGRIKLIPDVLPYTRGRRLKVCIIEQNIERLNYTYNDKEINQILSNTYKIVFASNNRKTADLVSELIGDEIITKDNDRITRRLILPQEIVNLEKREEIILTADSKVIKCDKFTYYEKPEFTKRILDRAKIK